MGAIGMVDLQMAGCAVKIIDFSGLAANGFDAAPLEVGIAQRRVDEAIAGRKRSNDFVEIEGARGGVVFKQAGHVAYSPVRARQELVPLFPRRFWLGSMFQNCTAESLMKVCRLR